MGRKNTLILLLLLALFVLLFRFPSLDEPLDNDSGAIAYHARLILRGETLYNSEHHTGHHLPGVYLSYAAAFLLFGDQQFAPKWLLIPWTVFTAWLIFALARRFSSDRAAFLAAFFYSLASAQIFLKGLTAETELFANLPITAAVLVLLAVSEHRRTWAWLLAGLLSAAAIIYKIIYVAPAAAALAFLLAELWSNRPISGKMAFRRYFSQGALFTLGLAVPLAGMAAWFASQGLWARFWLVFQNGFGYVSGYTTDTLPALPLPPLVGFPLFWMALNNASLLVFGLAGAWRFGRRKDYPVSVRAAVLVWLAVSFFQAGVSSIGFAHYVLLVLPPLALLAGFEIAALGQSLDGSGRPRLGRVVVGGLAGLVLANALLTGWPVYRQELAYRLGWQTYEQMLAQRPGTGKIYLRLEKIAAYLRQHTRPEDRIYTWSQEVQMYYLADRRCAIDILWPLYVSASGSPQRIFSSSTRYVLVEPGGDLSIPDWLHTGLQQGYALETTIEGVQIYRQMDAP